MGYYPAWENTSGLLPVNNIAFAYLTHIAFVGIIPRSDGTLNTNFYIDAINGPTLAADVAARAHFAGKKALLMVGGAGAASSGFAGAASDAYRATFVANLISTKNRLGYDGIDIDWEPIPNDTSNYQKLIEDLRAADTSILITTAVSQINPNFQTAKPVFASIWPLVDQINIMTYDMAYNGAGWSSWHNAPLMHSSRQTPTSVKSSVDAYLDAGVPRQKLGIGSPFYGQAWRGVTGPQQSLVGVTQVGNDSLLSYRNILSIYYTTEACRWDDVAKVPYLTFGVQSGPVGATYISYENERSVLEKTEYIKEQGLGGIVIWTLGEGYLTQGTQPLLQAIYGGLFGNARP